MSVYLIKIRKDMLHEAALSYNNMISNNNITIKAPAEM